MKKIAFEYVVYKLIEWYKAAKNQSNNVEFNSSNDLNKLKIIKLHFFVSSINSKTNSLLTIFDKFYAMPYGHVESDIYNSITALDRYNVGTGKLSIKDEYLTTLNNSFQGITPEIIQQIDEAIEMLKTENIKLIALSALDLVEISHNYFSWKFIFNSARSNQKYSEQIPAELIKEETKYYSLSHI